MKQTGELALNYLEMTWRSGPVALDSVQISMCNFMLPCSNVTTTTAPALPCQCIYMSTYVFMRNIAPRYGLLWLVEYHIGTLKTNYASPSVNLKF